MNNLTERIHWQNRLGNEGQSYVLDKNEEIEPNKFREVGVIFWSKNEPPHFRATGRDLVVDELKQIIILLEAHKS